jgi:hypothetical protein
LRERAVKAKSLAVGLLAHQQQHDDSDDRHEGHRCRDPFALPAYRRAGHRPAAGLHRPGPRRTPPERRRPGDLSGATPEALVRRLLQRGHRSGAGRPPASLGPEEQRRAGRGRRDRHSDGYVLAAPVPSRPRCSSIAGSSPPRSGLTSGSAGARVVSRRRLHSRPTAVRSCRPRTTKSPRRLSSRPRRSSRLTGLTGSIPSDRGAAPGES